MTTCLFTGEPTGPDTNEEHTIPRGIAGRFRSRAASASAFNAACSHVLDAPLVETYALVMNALAPLLSAEYQPGLLEVEAAPGDGRVALAPGAAGRLREPRIDARDPATGRPTALSARNDEDLRRIGTGMQIDPDLLRQSVVRPIASANVTRRQRILSLEVEVAVLKSALLTFDHVFGSDPNGFPRAAVLGELRDAILDVVRGGEPLRLVATTSWGIDYDRLGAFRALVEPHRRAPRSDFEHVLVACLTQNGPVDIFFLVAGIDLFRYRIYDRWPGTDLNILCGAGMLAGDAPYGPVALPRRFELGDQTPYRSVGPVTATGEERDAICRGISARRVAAVRSGHALVEMQADDFVRKQFIELETLGATSLDVAITRRMTFLYDRVLTEPQQARLGELVAAGLGEIGDDLRLAVPSAVAATAWLPRYRDLFARALRELGPPGRIFEHGH